MSKPPKSTGRLVTLFASFAFVFLAMASARAERQGVRRSAEGGGPSGGELAAAKQRHVANDAGAPAPLMERSLRFERLSIEEQSGGAVIYSILQDRRGFIWLGTNAGLKRHDGYGFLIFENDPTDPSSLASNDIHVLLEDRAETLWIGTEVGLHRFDHNTRTFDRLPLQLGSEDGLSDPRIRALCEDREGNLWVGTENGLNRLDPRTGKVTQWLADPSNPDSLGRSVVQAVTEDRHGKIWIGTREGLERLDPQTASWTRYLHDSEDPESLPWPVVTRVFEDGAGLLWVGTDGGGLSKLDRDSGKFTVYTENASANSPHNSVTSIVEDDSGLWVGTYGGLKEFDRGSGRFVTHAARPHDPNGLTSDWIETLSMDRGGNLWIGTQNGTNKLLRWRKRFNNHAHDPIAPESLPRGRVTAISEDGSGNLWLGTWGGGIAKRDHQTGRFTRYLHDPNDPKSLGRDWVAAMHHDRSGNLWVGTNSVGGLSRFDDSTGTFTHYRHDGSDPSSLSGNRVSSILEDGNGTLWFGTFGDGLNRLDGDALPEGRFRRYAHDPADPRSLSSYTIESLFEDRDGALWIGTAEGLDRFDRSADRFVRYEADVALSGAASLSVRVIHQDESGELWLGTDHGLARVDEESGIVRSVPELGDRSVFGLLEDNHGLLWIHTASGLTRYDPTDPTNAALRHFNQTDGWQQAAGFLYSSNAYFRSSAGSLLFGGVNGFTDFDPAEIQDNPHRPPVVLTDFQLSHESVSFGDDSPLERPIDETLEIRLSHRDNVVSFEFAALDFAVPENNQYAYQLEGFDQDWVSAGTARSATYTNLVPGDYTFRVKGSNNDGRWNEEGIAIDIAIAPGFWQTWWFRVLASVSALALMFQIHRGRVLRLERRAKLLKERVREGTAELFDKNQHLQEEIHQRQRVEEALQYRIGIEILIASLSNNFINLSPRNVDRGIHQALEMIGSFGQVDRSYVFLLSDDRTCFSNTHEWCAEGAAPMLATYQNLPCDRFPWFMKKLQALEVIHIQRPEDLPPEERTLRAFVEKEGLQSFINVPMAASGKLIGYLGFDCLGKSKSWSKDDIRLLKMVGEMFVSAFERRKTAEELHSAQAQLLQSEKTAAIGQLTAGILHELNTPVGVLRANADLAGRCVSRLEETLPEQQDGPFPDRSIHRRAFAVLKDSSRANASASARIVEILDNLKTFIQLDESPRTLMDIHEGINSALVLLGGELRAGIAVRKDYGDLPPIVCCGAELNQVFMTILERAIHAIDGEGVVTVRTAVAAVGLIVRIADTGRGMPPDALERLFDLNFENTGSRVHLGMGFAQAFTIVQRHRGTIDVVSSPEEGTEFVITLPCEAIQEPSLQPTA